jgi:hypothetical protein
MDPEIQRLSQEVAQMRQEMGNLEQKVALYENMLKSQSHNGYDGEQIRLENIIGLFRTISDSTEFTRATTVADRVPSSFSEQIFIYNNAGTYKLYCYDSVGKVWKSVTIA